MLVRSGVADRILARVPIFRRALTALIVRLRATSAGEPAGPSARGSGGTGSAAAETVPDVGELVRLLDDTLELARGLPDVQRREPVDVHDPIAAVLSRQASDRLTMREAPRPLFVLASPPALERLFEVLIENALANAARVIVRFDHGTSALIVHVDDDGPGVPRSERTHLFEPFPSLTAPAGTAGCARLAAAHRIASAHGGEIAVACSPEGGARFTVRLPLILDHELELAAAS